MPDNIIHIETFEREHNFISDEFKCPTANLADKPLDKQSKEHPQVIEAVHEAPSNRWELEFVERPITVAECQREQFPKHRLLPLRPKSRRRRNAWNVTRILAALLGHQSGISSSQNIWLYWWHQYRRHTCPGQYRHFGWV